MRSTFTSPDAGAGLGPHATWHMATEYPSSNISGVGLITFSELVSKLTHGQLRIRNSLDNAMQIGSGEMVRAAQEGVISGADAFAGPMEISDPIFGLSSLPFAVRSISAASATNARARPFYTSALRSLNLHLLYITIWPATGLWSNRAVETGEDLTSLRMRTYDYNSAIFMRELGVSAVYMPFNDAISKVKAGELDAIVTSGDGGAGRKLWEHLHHFTAINYAVPVSLAFVRRDEFEALSNAIRAGVERAAEETELCQLKLLSTRMDENYARMRANGVLIRETVSAQLAIVLREAATGPIAHWKLKVPLETSALLDGLD